MSRARCLSLFFAAVFLQAGAYGLTFLLPRLFASFGANEKVVGAMLTVTAVVTLLSVYFSGHLSDRLGRLRTLAVACAAIAVALGSFAVLDRVGPGLVLASGLLGFGWGLTYALCPVALARLVAPDARVRSFALLSIFVMAGFGLAPVLAAGLEALGATVRAAFGLTAGGCLISAGLFAALRDPMARYDRAPGTEARAAMTLATVGRILSSRALRPVIMVCLGASVFAGMNNFQTVFADARDLPYATFFAAYTATVVVLRLALVRFSGGRWPYLTIGALQVVMAASVALFLVSGGNLPLYIAVAVLFGVGYGASYPILVAMAANDAEADLGPQTLQLFALSYFVGIFGFPLIAGWLIVEVGTAPLLALVTGLAMIEAAMALQRGFADRSTLVSEAS